MNMMAISVCEFIWPAYPGYDDFQVAILLWSQEMQKGNGDIGKWDQHPQSSAFIESDRVIMGLS